MMNLLCFNLDNKEYAVSIDKIREVRRIKEVTPIPQALDFIEGVVSLRGRVVPIVNLRKKFGLPSIENKTFNRTLITDINNHILGIAVDDVVGVVTLDPSNIEPPDEVLKKAEYLIGVGRVGKRLMLLVDIEKLLSGEEKTGIADVHKKVEVRKRS